LAGFNSKTSGYAAGGFDQAANNRVTTVDKFLFATDARSTLATGLASIRSDHGSFSSAESGYVFGGVTSPTGQSTVISSTAEKFNFATDARTSLGTGLSVARFLLTGFASEANGYAAGGDTNNVNLVTTVDKFLFATDARSTLSTGLSAARRGSGGFQG
jgi:hypothetical protein